VVQAGAVLAFTEAFLDGGPVPEPGFQSDEVRVVGGDVGDDEADGPDVISGATEGERELVFLYGPAPAGPRGSTQPVSYTHLRAHETKANLVCRLLLEKKKK